MKKLALIPTREKKDYKICSYLKEAGFEVHLLINKKSIFSAYTAALTEYNVQAEDTVILCHDDIEILTDKSVFNSLLDAKLSDKTTGVVGVAGTQLFKRSAMWWEDLRQGNTSPLNPLLGCVYHGEDIFNLSPTYYGGMGTAVVMDGLFLATKGRTLFTVGTSKPSYFTGDWDFYDILYTFKDFKRGLKNLVIPIQILHNSGGEGMSKDSWIANREAFVSKFTDLLPASIR